jgi:hypothetical protein
MRWVTLLVSYAELAGASVFKEEYPIGGGGKEDFEG